MRRDDEIPDDRNPLTFVALSIVFAAVGIILFSIFLFIAVICFFIAFVWFVTGYAQWRRLKEEEKARQRTRF
ncbi:MAG: hypothetical protein ACFE7E_04590 [Candidatus Hodarchaeota archaeon]